MATTDEADQYRVERSATIAASPAAVYEELSDFHRWAAWSPWEDIDPAMQRTYSGPDSGVGATYAWSGNRKAGSGSMRITDAVQAERVVIDLHFLKPFKAQNLTTFTLAADGAGTAVTWTMVGKKTFMTKVMGIFTSMDKMIGKDFEKGLAQLRATAEG